MVVIIGLIVYIVAVALDVTGQIMQWSFNFFTGENGFIPTLNQSGVKTFYSMFAAGKINLLNVLVDKVVIPVGAAIVLVLFAFALYKSIVSDKATEAPWKIFFRGGVAIFLVFSSTAIFGILLNTANQVQVMAENAIGTSVLATYFEDTDTDGGYENIQDMANGAFEETEGEAGGGATGGSVTESIKSAVEGAKNVIVTSLIAFFLALILTWKFMKLVFQYLSRYVRVYLLVIFSPLAGASYAMESTAEIWAAYIRAYVGALVSVIISQFLLWGMKLASMYTVYSTNSFSELALYFSLTLGFCQFAENIDAYLDKVKLNLPMDPRTTLMNSIGMVMQKKAAYETEHIMGFAGQKIGDVATGIKNVMAGTPADKPKPDGGGGGTPVNDNMTGKKGGGNGKPHNPDGSDGKDDKKKNNPNNNGFDTNENSHTQDSAVAAAGTNPSGRSNTENPDQGENVGAQDAFGGMGKPAGGDPHADNADGEGQTPAGGTKQGKNDNVRNSVGGMGNPAEGDSHTANAGGRGKQTAGRGSSQVQGENVSKHNTVGGSGRSVDGGFKTPGAGGETNPKGGSKGKNNSSGGGTQRRSTRVNGGETRSVEHPKGNASARQDRNIPDPEQNVLNNGEGRVMDENGNSRDDILYD